MLNNRVPLIDTSGFVIQPFVVLAGLSDCHEECQNDCPKYLPSFVCAFIKISGAFTKNFVFLPLRLFFSDRTHMLFWQMSGDTRNFAINRETFIQNKGVKRTREGIIIQSPSNSEL